jgi:hypothetical protein
MIRQLFFTLFYLLISSQLIAQFNFEYSDSIGVKIGSDSLKLAWAGGLNYVQFSDFDFDYDGDLDLFVFDRSSDNIRVFTQEQSGGNSYYKLRHHVENYFPSDVRYRATMVDYNNDGKKDLFCYGIGGIKVYKNVGNGFTGPQWTVAKDLLYTDSWGSNLNLYVSSADIPAIVDVDGDGDIDVLTYHIGGEHVQYHQNQSMELYGVPDSLEFVLKNECWGGFREDLNSSLMYLNDQNSPCVTGNVPNPEFPIEDNETLLKPSSVEPKHSGSTLLAIDMDNSSVLDLIIGDVTFPNMNLLMNGGTSPNTNSLMISVDPTFPSNSQPVNMDMFPAAFWVDVDFDGKKDLIIGANAKNVSENVHSVWEYKNLGTNAIPTFVYQTNAFLQNQMIEHGTGSVPVFADINNDGLEDMFVANFFRYKPSLDKESSIAFYQNVGTTSSPSFLLIDDDFLNLSTSGLGLRMIPSFGDLDYDGDLDFYLGLENGKLAYFQNISSLPIISFAPPVFNLEDNTGSVINVGQYAHPQLFDLNKDGLLDLIIGKKTGEISYYENTGTISNPSFELMNDTLGNIDLATTSPDGYPSPHFFEWNDTTYLFVGCVDGQLHFYKNIDGNLSSGQDFTLTSSNYLNIDAGSYSSFFVNDIDNDGFLDLFVGQDLGGLSHLEVDPNSQSSLNELIHLIDLKVFPNPSKGIFKIESEYPGVLKVKIFDLFGKMISTQNSFSHETTIDLSQFASNIYIIQLENEQGYQTSKRIMIVD